MTILAAREERAQLPLSCAGVAKKSQQDSVGSNAPFSVGLPGPRALSPIAEQHAPVLSLPPVCSQLLSLLAFQKGLRRRAPILLLSTAFLIR